MCSIYWFIWKFGKLVSHWIIGFLIIVCCVLPKPPRVTFRNPKTLRDKLVRSKIRENDEEQRGNFPCGHSNCEVCKILEPGKEFQSSFWRGF